jgi:TrmH family RNA methyltransferase
MPKRKKLTDLKLSKNPLIVILEQIEKPGNLGAILRTAAAASTEAVIAADPHTDFYNPNVIRASQGTCFKQTLVSASSSEIFQWLKKQKIPLYAATAHGNVLYTDIDWRSASAIAFGEESQGLTKVWRQKAKAQIKIPCPKSVSSLNISVAAGIIIYEAWRQRKFQPER